VCARENEVDRGPAFSLSGEKTRDRESFFYIVRVKERDSVWETPREREAGREGESAGHRKWQETVTTAWIVWNVL